MIRYTTVLRRLYIFEKRLFKKPSYIAVLLLICAMTLSLSFITETDSSILRISVYAADTGISELLKSGETQIDFEAYNDRGAAIASLEHGTADAVWLFDKQLDLAVREFIHTKKPIVQVLQRTDNVFLRLSRERLFATVYPYISRGIYENFMAGNFNKVNQADMDSFLNGAHIENDIAELKFHNSEDAVYKPDHILGAVRGLLAISVFICSFAGLLSYKRDFLSGIYSNITRKELIFVKAANVFLPALNIGIISLIALLLCKKFTSLGFEAVSMLMLILMSALFCMILDQICNKLNFLTVFLPISALLMLAVCPIFIYIDQLSVIGHIFPPYYYLSAFADERYLLYSLFYVGISGLLLPVFKHFNARRLT